MKRIICIILLLLAVLPLTACSSPPSEIILEPLKAESSVPSEEAAPPVRIVTRSGTAIPAIPDLSEVSPDRDVSAEPIPSTEEVHYVLNTNTRRFHLPDCPSVEEMKPSNRREYTGSREALLTDGYRPCGRCKP